MGFFKRKRREPWNTNNIPDLSFAGAPDFVDIGFLGGDEHREAFACIFAKMLVDNKTVLLGIRLIGIDAKKQFTISTSIPTLLLEIDPHRFARELYDSHNNKVILKLSSEGGEMRLGMCFDNPSFWLENAAT